MFSYFEPNFIEKFFWESVFFSSNFGQSRRLTVFREMEISILAAILKRYMFFKLFLLIYGFLRCTSMVQVLC